MTTETRGRTIGPFKFTDVDDHVDAGSGTRFHFEYQGESYIAEEWHTDNSDGLEIYDSTGAPVDPILEEHEEAWEQALEEMQERWQDAHARIISYAYEKAVQRTLFMTEKPIPYVRPRGL